MAADLEEMRNRMNFTKQELEDVYRECDINDRFAAGDPFEEVDKQAWVKATGREPVVVDELGQYLNRVQNAVLENQWGIEMTPTSERADDKTAADRQDIARGIEYIGNADACRASAFESMCRGGVGVYAMNKRYKAGSRYQELYYRTFLNRRQVWWDPTIKQVDGSDQKHCFITTARPKKEFEKEHGKDARSSADGLDQDPFASTWFTTLGGSDYVTEAEYWYMEKEKQRLLYLAGSDGREIDLSQRDMDLQGMQIRDGKVWVPQDGEWAMYGDITGERMEDVPCVYQCRTNGYDELDKTKWDTSNIPVFLMLGRQIWVNRGGTMKRRILSLISLARDPYLLLCYVRSKQAILTGMAPLVPWLAIEGQIDATPNGPWVNAHRIPQALLTYKYQLDHYADAAGNKLPLPPPTRATFEPQIQALEVFAEALRRQIQAAVGMTGLPTNAQKLNDKSGKAIEEINSAMDLGAYHFTSAYRGAMEFEGRVMNDQIDYFAKKGRSMPAMTTKGKGVVLKIGEEATDPRDKMTKVIKLGYAMDHAVTISVGPSQDSARAEANAFMGDMLKGGLLEAAIAQRPDAAPAMAALAIKATSTGGELVQEMADILDPEETDSPQAKMLQVQGENQQLHLVLKQADQIMDGQAKVIARLQSGIDKQEVADAGKQANTALQGKLDMMLELVKQMGEDKRQAIVEEGKDVQSGRERSMKLIDVSLGEISAELAHSRQLEAATVDAALQPEPEPAAAV